MDLTRSYVLSEVQARVFFFILTLFSLSKYHKGYFLLVGFDIKRTHDPVVLCMQRILQEQLEVIWFVRQWNPVKKVTNGSKNFSRINQVSVLPG